MKDYTEIIFLLDKSGSMSSVCKDTIGGINLFIHKQKEDKDETVFSFYQFATHVETIYIGKKIQDVENVTEHTYIPNGYSTALLDAIGKIINETGDRFNSMKESDKPSKVIFVIQTDGLENDSHTFTKDQIKSMIEHQESKYSWKFIFLGTNFDAFAEAQTMGINSSNSLTYTNNSRGINVMYESVANSISNMKGMDQATYTSATTFTKEDLLKQEEAKNA